MAAAQELQDKVERFVSLFFTGGRQQAFWFWFLGLGILIPTLTYISATLIGLLLVLVLDLIGISSAGYIKPMALGLSVVCGAISLFGYYRLWIIYREKKSNKLRPT
jgi:polyferredoxin